MMIKKDYVAPEVEIIQVAVEKGFATTGGYENSEGDLDREGDAA